MGSWMPDCYHECMMQLTLRVPDDLANDLKRVAAERGQSVNALATQVLAAVVDPELAADPGQRLRERLARAGLLAGTAPLDKEPPDEDAVRRARAAAGAGKPLADYVSEGRD
jgi:predicted transcriptional regulator